MNLGGERGQRHAHVRRMRRDAGLAPAEDRVDVVGAFEGGAAATGLAFIAGRRDVVQIVAARTLEEIAASRRHVAQLCGRAGKDCARDNRIALFDQRMVGKVGIRHQRADPQSPTIGLFDCVERQPRDVDQPRRAFDILLHEIDQVSAAGDEFRGRIGGHLAHRIGDIVGSRVLEIDHDCTIACRSPQGCWDTPHRRCCRSSSNRPRATLSCVSTPLSRRSRLARGLAAFAPAHVPITPTHQPWPRSADAKAGVHATGPCPAAFGRRYRPRLSNVEYSARGGGSYSTEAR
jgi:hypothetical protein